MELGERILKFRADNNLTQAQFAKLAGVHENMIGRYENGRAKPKKTKALQIEKVLGSEE